MFTWLYGTRPPLICNTCDLPYRIPHALSFKKFPIKINQNECEECFLDRVDREKNVLR